MSLSMCRGMVVPMVAIALGWSGCDATKELVKAPFDATTAVSDGTTQASSELTQPSKEFTSSTTPGSRVGSDSLLRAKQRLQTFTAYNFDNIQHEIAQGRGEYLASLATLAQVPTESHPQFFAQLQGRYSSVFAEAASPADSTRRLVDEAWSTPLGRHAE